MALPPGDVIAKGTFRRIVWPFAVVETLVWACYYYSFPALLPTWEAELGFSKAVLTGAFTLSLTVSAVLAPVAGRLIDRGYSRVVFAGGAALAAVLLLLLSQVRDVWQFYVIWFALGVAMSGTLYEACFTILTHCLGARARRAITMVSLAAGFAGTVSFPSAHFLTQFLGWRGAIVIFAGVVVVVCIPLILYGCHHAARVAPAIARPPSANPRAAARAVRTVTFWLLALSFTSIALDHTLLVSHMLPIMADRGLAVGTAVAAASMMGPMQVAGRLLMLSVEHRVSTRMICCTCFVSMGLAGTALYLAGMAPGLVIVFVALQGSGAGVLSVIRPTAVAELLGRTDFGVTAGLLAIGFVGGSAVAPILASLIWQVGGYDLVIILTMIVPLVGLTSALAAWRFRPRDAALTG